MTDRLGPATASAIAGLKPPGNAGFTVIDLVFSLAIVAVLAGLSVPQLTAGLERARGLAAAHYLASQFSSARLQAATRSTAVAVRLAPSEGELAIAMVLDGNGNGVHATEIESGVDTVMQPPVLLSRLFPGIGITPPGGEPPGGVGSPGSGTVLSSLSSPSISFSPDGTAFSGTVQVTAGDGSRFAVRVLGPTARIRVLRWASEIDDWADVF